MSKRFIDGSGFLSLTAAAAERLNANVQRVNALNVFPVPDGDTGTNMNLTFSSGLEELRRRTSPEIGASAEALAKGLLMGARGNSGVILSQLFRGFAKGVAGLGKADAEQFAQALQQGVETAYKAVVRPVEGTILTVSREAAKAALQSARRTDDIARVMRDTLEAAKEALAHTPELLPVLKQVGVVDSGGQGLVYIYEGFLSALSGELPEADASGAAADQGADQAFIPQETIEALHRAAAHAPVQAQIDAGTIEHGYCTEFIIRLNPAGREAFEEQSFRGKLEEFGDSLVVVSDDELVKIHIHAEYPGEVMTFAQQFGDLTRIKIENMREQHSHIISHDLIPDEPAEGGRPVEGAAPAAERTAEPPVPELDGCGIIAVSAGAGLSDIFTSLGVHDVISGGQTMNPSTEDILNAIERVPASRVIVLPNNSNIIMAANQAKELSGKEVAVIPTKTIQQGVAALLAYNGDADLARNEKAMTEAAGRVKSGQITFAVRDSSIDGVNIQEGDYIGILDGRIVVAKTDPFEACAELVRTMLGDGEEVLSVYVGEAAQPEVTDKLRDFFENEYPDLEVELLPGGQPVYSYLFSAE